MSVTLNNSDFQCLQDQLLDLKNKNYELAERNRRGQADFEAAKAKICNLQLKLEEQERDFAVTSTTLRREIEVALHSSKDQDNNEVDHKSENKKLLLKLEELQQHQSGTSEIMQQMDSQNRNLIEKVRSLETELSKLKEHATTKQNEIDVIKKEFEKKLNQTITEYKTIISEEKKKNIIKIEALTAERDSLKTEVERLDTEVKNFDNKLESQAEERKIQDRKGLKIVKELKRQLALEKSRTETLQRRLENLLKEQTVVPVTEIDTSRLSTSSSTNGNSSSNENGSHANTNQDANSVGSWSFVQGKGVKSSNLALNEALSICSIDSEDRETVQQPGDTNSEDSAQQTNSDVSTNMANSSTLTSVTSPNKTQLSTTTNQLQSRIDGLIQNINSTSYSSHQNVSDGLLLEEQAALVERLTKMQHEKWMLEEKLSYMEQANSSLTEDLANKSEIIKNYFMDQAHKASTMGPAHFDSASLPMNSVPTNNNINSRRTSFPNNVNYILSDRPSLKKVVDFLKERSQISMGESENISKEAMKKMQLMLEETLIKCLKLQENLDFVSFELDKLKS